jgi:hypothetical protein
MILPSTPRVIAEPGKIQGLKQASRALSRYQQYYKQMMLELIDIETREKEMQSLIAIQVDSATTYKGFIHPNILRFNEEIYGEVFVSEEEKYLR